MTSSLTFHFHVLDLCNTDQRTQVRKLLNGEKSGSIHQLDGSCLNKEDLLSILKALPEENEAIEISLDDLANLSGGVGLPEALVSSTMLMAMVAGASGLFSSSMNAVNKSQIQDSLNAGVSANIENVRNDLSNLFLNTSTGEYQPTPNISANLGAEFLKTLSDNDGNSANGSQENFTIGDQVVQRTITADGNTIEISYTHLGTMEQIDSTTMVSPAAGWLPWLHAASTAKYNNWWIRELLKLIQACSWL